MTHEYPKRDATVCHWCRKKFYLSQTHYLVEDEIEAWPGWERVSICGLCWVDSNAPSTVKKLKCLGCGETIKVPLNWRTGPKSAFSQIIVGALCCSNRCHQRARRMHRDRWPQRCEVCKEQFTPRRTDALYCSDPCRQWAYRRRKAQKTGNGSSRHGMASRVTGPIGPRDVTLHRYMRLNRDVT